MKRVILALSLIVGLFYPAFAQRTPAVDVITTRNGDVFEGYIIRQIPGKSLTILSVQTTMTVSREDAERRMVRKQMVGDLPEECIKLFPMMPDDSRVELADIRVIDRAKENTFRKCVIVEDGDEITFVSFDPVQYDLKWSEIRKSGKVPYDFTDPASFCDKLSFKNGDEWQGQFLEQDLHTGIVRFRLLDGNIRTIRKNNILSLRCGMLHPEENLWLRIPYCDKVILKDGSFEEGFIVSKVFGQSIEMQQSNSDLRREIPIGEIEAYEKYRNPLYEVAERPKEEEILADLYINGLSFPKQRLEQQRGSYCVKTSADSLKAVVNACENVVIKYKGSARTSQIVVVKARLEKEKVLGLTGLNLKKKGTELWPVFKKTDILPSPDINFQSNDGEYIVADITFDTPGVYVLWIQGREDCVAIQVK